MRVIIADVSLQQEIQTPHAVLNVVKSVGYVDLEQGTCNIVLIDITHEHAAFSSDKISKAEI